METAVGSSDSSDPAGDAGEAQKPVGGLAPARRELPGRFCRWRCSWNTRCNPGSALRSSASDCWACCAWASRWHTMLRCRWRRRAGPRSQPSVCHHQGWCFTPTRWNSDIKKLEDAQIKATRTSNLAKTRALPLNGFRLACRASHLRRLPPPAAADTHACGRRPSGPSGRYGRSRTPVLSGWISIRVAGWQSWLVLSLHVRQRKRAMYAAICASSQTHNSVLPINTCPQPAAATSVN